MIKNIILDFGNVTIKFIKPDIVAKVTTEPTEHKLLLDAVFAPGRFEDTDRGFVTLEQHKEMTKQYLPQELYAKADQLLETWFLDLPIMEGMEELIKDLKMSGYGIYLLSNINIQ